MALNVAGPIRVAVDGGAFHGGVSRELLGLFPESEVHAFEPQPELFSKLEAEARGNPRWHVYQLALSDQDGASRFHVPAATYTASLLTPGGSLGPATEISVQTTTLAAWAANLGVVPDLLKLDLQGAELHALRGAEPIMAGVRAVAVEVNFEPRYEDCARFGDVVSFLESAGMYLHRLYEIHSGAYGRWRFADALFFRS